MNSVSIDHSEATMVQDGTAAPKELNHMTSRLKEVGWQDFQIIWEKHQSVPSIWFPWGI
jgi:hypothetical protein